MDKQKLHRYNKKLEAVSEELNTLQSNQQKLLKDYEVFITICEKRTALMKDLRDTWRTGEMNQFVHDVNDELNKQQQRLLDSFEEERTSNLKKKEELEDKELQMTKDRIQLSERADCDEY